MQRFLLLILVAFATVNLSAQVLLVTSPASAEGAYLFEAGGFGGDVTLDTIYNGELILADDGVGTTSDACEPLMNDATDKFVLLDRGDCEFGVKCLGAEAAGATLVIVANNVAGPPIVMGAGAVGGQVTIPCVMISMDDGQALKDAMAAGTVEVSFGNISFDNDLGSFANGISLPIMGAIPANQIMADESFIFNPGVNVTNKGLIEATGVTVDGTLSFAPAGGSGSTVYEESTTLADPLASDSSQYVALPDYDLSGSDVGVYTINYTISGDAMDESLFDNDFTQSMNITENTFAKAPIDLDTGLPVRTNAYTTAGGGNIEFLTGYNIPNGLGNRLDSITFYVSAGALTLDQTPVQVLVYQWIDGDENGSYDAGEFTVVGFNQIEFPAGSPEAMWVSTQVLDLATEEPGITIPFDDVNYVIGTRYEGAESVFFGFNEDYDYTTAFAEGAGAIQSDLDRPYLGSSANDGLIPDLTALFTFTDLQAPTTTAIHVNPIIDNTEEILPEGAANVVLYPNPVSDELTVKVELEALTQDFEYRISDINGRLIQTIQKGQLKEDVSKLNVSQLPAGQYILTVVTDKGISTQTFVRQ